MRTPTSQLLNKIVQQDFARLNDKMVENAVKLMEEEKIPDTLTNFLRALDAEWEAYAMCN